MAITLSASQSINVDFGTGMGPPPSTYGAAAGSAGHWNEIDMTGPVNTPIGLVDVTGAATAATVEYTAKGSGNYAFNHPGTVGSAELLMDDLCDLGNANLVKYIFRDLQPGTYQVYAYSWAPDYPLVYSTKVEAVTGALGAQECGGVDWPGDHALSATYVMDTVVVTDGRIRFRFTPSAGFGSANGIQLVGPSSCVTLSEAYCTPGTSASGCRALLSTAGTASATSPSGFVLSASNVEGGKDGLFFFGISGRQQKSWGGGTSFQCVVPPVKRAGLLTGSGAIGACDGSFGEDLNALWAATPAKNPGAGALVQAQLWYRDPLSVSNKTTSLSNAVEFTVCQ